MTFAVKQKTARVWALLALLSATFMLTACPKQITINQLQNDPRNRNRDVAILGRVVRSFGALDFGVYELDDETGRIWVLTKRGVPNKGAQVLAIGRYTNGVTWEGKSYANALEETNRKVR